MTDRDLTPKTDEPRAVDLWDRTETRSVLNLVPHTLAAKFLEAARARPEMFGLDERDLFKALRSDNMVPSPTDNRIRLQFWFEYDRAQHELRNMQPAAIYAGVCSKQYFYGTFLDRAEKVAWMMTPPVDYVTKINEALDFGLDRMRDILETDPKDIPEKSRIKFMELQAKIVAMLDQRAKGGFVQKVEQKNMNLHVATTDKQVAAAMTTSTMDELDKKIKELERRERRALNLQQNPEPITVEAEVVNEAEK